MTSIQLLHKWASQQHEKDKCGNLKFHSLYVLQYYNTELAVIIPHTFIKGAASPNDSVVVIQKNKFGKTLTSKVYKEIWCAGRHLKKFVTAYTGFGNGVRTSSGSNMRAAMDEAVELIKESGKPRLRDTTRAGKIELAKMAISRAIEYDDFLVKNKIPQRRDAIIKGYAFTHAGKALRAKAKRMLDDLSGESYEKILKKAKADEEAKRKASDAAAAEYRAYMERRADEYALKWINHEEPPGQLGLSNWSKMRIRITKDGEFVETIHGATAPLGRAVAIFRLISRGYTIKPNLKIGDYHVKSEFDMNSESITIGCHSIPMSEIIRVIEPIANQGE